jgi:fused signal recognition particle receptor
MSDVTPTSNRAADPGERKGWLARLRRGLGRSSNKLSEGISGIFTKRKLDDETLEELEDLLISADLGPSTAARLTASLARSKFGREVDELEVREALAEEIAGILEPVARPLEIDKVHRPSVLLVVGVNGTGKTTTIGKLAAIWKQLGLTVLLAAGDTFRAAAIGQLQVWGDRARVPVLTRETGSDAAALAFDATRLGEAQNADLVVIDTAGRLQNKADLMAELSKIVRVLGKRDPTSPHHVVLVLDATTGQNAHAQVEAFQQMVNVSGLIVTKLDGSAKGGVLVSLAERFGLPVHAIGVGEQLEDLRAFEARAFARSLLGLDPDEG